MESSGDKIKFLCTGRRADGSLSIVSIASAQTLQIWASCNQNTPLSCEQFVPFHWSFSGHAISNHHFMPPQGWMQFTDIHESFIWLPPQTQDGRVCCPKMPRWGRWWVGRKRGTGEGSDLPRATPSVNISPVSSEPYFRDLCTVWVFLTYWTSILWMLLEFQYWITANGKARGDWGCLIYQLVYVGFYCFLEELSISPDLPLFRCSNIFLCKYRIFRASLSSQGNSFTMNWILFSPMWQKRPLKFFCGLNNCWLL